MRKPRITKASTPAGGRVSKPRKDKEPQIGFGATGRIDFGTDRPKSKKPGKPGKRR